MREERGHGIVASYWYVLLLFIMLYSVTICAKYTFTGRWPTENMLIINITSHSSQQSLVHLAGLVAVPKAVQSVAPNGSLDGVPTVDSEDMLFAAGKGQIQQWFGGYYHILINPGNTGHLGHSVHFHF
jgi:hypothetical protein